MSMVPGGVGYVPVPTPGTPVQVKSTPLAVKQVVITPMKASGVANTGNVYVGTIGAADHRADGVGVIAVLRPGDGPLRINRGDDMDSSCLDLSNLWIDANTAADGVLVGYVQ